MVKEPSITFDFALVNTDCSGEDLDQVIMHLLFVLVNRLLPSHMCRGLHILLSQECETALEEFDTLRIGASIVTSQEHGDFTDP